jgi:uncharacterized protein (TIGR03000 family)
MSGSRFIAPMLAAWATAMLCLSAGPIFASPSHTNSNHGGYSSYHGGYHASYNGGYHPGYYAGYHSSYNGGYHAGYFAGYHTGYYGGYPGGYYPGYFSYPGGNYPSISFRSYYAPAYSAPAYAYPSAPPSIYSSFSGAYTGGLGAAPAASDQPPPPDGTAAVSVVVPSDAEVWFNGDPTKQKGEHREFVTPTLPVGRAYQYEVRARWKENGITIDQTRTVIVHANERANADFTQAEPLGAPTPAK